MFDHLDFFFAGASGFRGDKRGFKGGRNLKRPVHNAHVRSEIKDLNQVSKDRQKKADRVSYLKSQQNKKGKKFGKNSKRGMSSNRGKGSDDRGKSGYRGKGADDRGKSGNRGKSGGGKFGSKGKFDNKGKSGGGNRGKGKY